MMKKRNSLFLLLIAGILVDLLFLTSCSAPPAAAPEITAVEPVPAPRPAGELPPAEVSPVPTAPATESVALPPKEDEETKAATPATAPRPPATPTWKKGGMAVAGPYADAELVPLDKGQWRMYYSLEPEVENFQGQVYSALSSDGKTWTPEAGQRKQGAIFPDVLRLPDGRWRMYFQNQGVIKSAVSSDGKNWNDEPGVRVDTTNPAGLLLDNVGASTSMKIDNEYVMVYRGTINQRYAPDVPNNNIQLFLWATSADGLSFQQKGIALDSRNELFSGLLDGPDFVRGDDGSVRVYFWSYKGVYSASFENSRLGEPKLEYSTAPPGYGTAADSRRQFPPSPPGDPSLAKIKGQWFMYYGTHTKGIEYAVLTEETVEDKEANLQDEGPVLQFDFPPAQSDPFHDSRGPFFHDIRKAASADGLQFKKEAGVVFEKASVPDALQLPDGTICLVP